MRTALERTIDFIWHPFLLVTFDLLALLAANLGQVPAIELMRPWLFLTLLAGFLLGMAWLALRDRHRAGLIVTTLLGLLLSYGHIYGLMEGIHLQAVNIGRHRVLLVIFVLLFLALVVLILRSKRSLVAWTLALNLVTGILVIMPASQLAWDGINDNREQAEVRTGKDAISTLPFALGANTEKEKPDIYYIILDTYTRQDAYQAVLGFDNSAFIAALQERGFIVVDCSQSNYSSTSASILSSLDGDYLWQLEPALPVGLNQIRYLDPYLQENRAMATLKQLGYTTVSFESGYSPTELTGTDVYLTPVRAELLGGGLTRFESLALQSSAGVLMYDLWPRLPAGLRYFLDAPYVDHRERILYELDRLGQLGDIPSPKFVFVHVLAPHTPFVFTRDGQPVPRDTPFTLNDDTELGDPALYVQRFVDQTVFLNGQVLAALDAILAQGGDPIIILQGDHGLPSSGGWDTTILNAIRLPEGSDALYPSISPVNTFRVVFDELFGAGLPLLPDRSCRFNRSDPDACEPIPEPNPECLAEGIGP